MENSNFDLIQLKLTELGYRLEIISEIKSGKEATVFAINLDDQLLAMKVYAQNINLKNKNDYLAGKFYKSSSHKRAVKTKAKFGQKLVKYNWISREFHLLQKLFKYNASVPKPILQVENAILMEFIGERGRPAPRLIDLQLDQNQMKNAWNGILSSLQIFAKAGIVHGDLSAYNILWWQNQIWIIDLPQAIDIRFNENKHELLTRDIQNIASYFESCFEVDIEEVIKKLDQI